MVAVFIVGSWATFTLVRAVDPKTVFEIDGDIDEDDDNNAATQDWWNNNCAVPDSSTASAFTGAVPDPYGTTVFTGGGSKDYLDIPEWLHKSGSVPPKDEIVNAYAAKYGNILVVGGDRFAINGAAQIGAWFLQNAIGLDGVDQQGGTTFTGDHANGDILVLAEFTIGGTASGIDVYMWVGSAGPCPNGPCPPVTDNGTLAKITGLATDAVGASNPVDVMIPGTCPEWQYEDSKGNLQTFPINAFFEVGIDLDQLGVGNVCFASFVLETRSSHETNATLKDFAFGGFEACVVECTKSVSPPVVCEGESATYTITAINPGASDLDVDIDDSIYGNICLPTIDGDPCLYPGDCSPGNNLVAGGESRSCTITAAPMAGTYMNEVTVVGTVVGTSGGGTTDPGTCDATLTVNPQPTVEIEHLVGCEYTSTFELCANPTPGAPGDYTYSWSSGDTTQCITKSATGSYMVTATDANGCFDDDIRKVGFCSD